MLREVQIGFVNWSDYERKGVLSACFAKFNLTVDFTPIVKDLKIDLSELALEEPNQNLMDNEQAFRSIGPNNLILEDDSKIPLEIKCNSKTSQKQISFTYRIPKEA